jgi:hypothetical protein
MAARSVRATASSAGAAHQCPVVTHLPILVNVKTDPALPLTGVQNGQADDLLSLIADDHIVIRQFTISGMTGFF